MTTISIPLSKRGRKHAGKYETIVDSIDADLGNLNWRVRFDQCRQYAFIRQKSRCIHLHRIILARKLERDELLPHELVDHIDGDGLNNKRENLRLATNSQNNANKTKYKNNKSGYKGVSWDKERNKWTAQIYVNKKHIRLGRFDTSKLAYQAYCEAVDKYHGEYGNKG